MEANASKRRYCRALATRSILLVTAAVLAVRQLWTVCRPGTRRLAAMALDGPRTGGDISVDALVQELAAAALLCAGGVLAAMLALAAADALIGARLPRLRAAAGLLTPRLCRRVVAVCCGAGLVAPGYAVAASADDGNGRHGCVAACGDSRPRLGGLALPDLPVGGVAIAERGPRSSSAMRPPGAPRLVVDIGDSLWSLAERRLPANASDAAVLALSARLYDRNHRVIGDDPDLILPGITLVIPEGAS